MMSIIVLSNCKKEILKEPTTGSTNQPVALAKSLTDLKTSAGFDWKTSKSVRIEIIGTPTLKPVKGLLKIEAENGAILFSKTQLMNETTIVSLKVPNHLKNLTIRYGKIVKTVPISASIRTDYLPQLSNPE